MKIIITRHGETIENKNGTLMGHLPGTLSEEGINQAKKVAQRLSGEKIDFIYSSDLARASDTAKEIAKFHENVPLLLFNDLREQFLGEWQGKKKSDLGLENVSLGSVHSKDGETSEKLFLRAKDFVSNTLSKHDDEDVVLIVAHNGINKALVTAIENKETSDIKSVEKFHNTSVTIYNINNGKYSLELFNCKKHLE